MAAPINAGGKSVENWQADSYSSATYSSASFNAVVGTSGVTNPAPQGVYQTYVYSTSQIGSKLAYKLPVQDGTYTLRLHFAEPGGVPGAGYRLFDIQVNGQIVRPAYDIYAAAGGYYKAAVVEVEVSATGGQGLSVELVTQSSFWNYPALLSGLELVQASPAGVAAPTFDLEVSYDDASWQALASGLSVDRFGKRQLSLDADG